MSYHYLFSHQCVSHYINACHVTLTYAMSHQCVSCHINVCHVTSMCVMSHQCVSCHINACHVTSMRIMSHQCGSCHINICHVTSLHISSRHFTSHLVIVLHATTRQWQATKSKTCPSLRLASDCLPWQPRSWTWSSCLQRPAWGRLHSRLGLFRLRWPQPLFL